jgi:plastocyanin
MALKWYFAAGVAVLVAAAVAGTVASRGEASLATVTVSLRADGPSPSVARLTAGLAAPSWVNEDSSPHTVSFLNGQCTFLLSPNARQTCTRAFWRYVGRYEYSVDGIDAMLDVGAASRKVSLTVPSHLIRRGASLLLHGDLTYSSYLSLPSPQPVVVMARPLGATAYHRIARITTRLQHEQPLWQLRVHPRTTTTYLVEANAQPADGQIWQYAQSEPVTVVATG